ncbi:type IV secretion system protein VirB8 [Epibacterium ulvae]|uniref:Type IV secretion system protein VirB8 n=1 Tax=Epibacterium ulvae TaxID=1156985 RepID=A0A1G5RHG4_9RHOB|nr:VirB8/TrbF family protein [Epibacterium ulvae]SCZ73504.1 type IV secretion system protein VirB8 [Epibacterium ulvae]
MIQTDKELRKYLDESRSFDQDRLLAAQRSKRLAWAVAGVSGLIACAGVFAIAALAPLKSVEPFVIRVDQATGVPEVMTALTDGQEAYEEAIAKYFLALYVRTREGYSYAARNVIFNHVMLMSGTEEQAEFSAHFNASNPDSPQYVYGRKTKAEVEIRSVSFLDDGLAQVRYYLVTKHGDEDLERRSQWVATINYEFDSAAEISSQDRLINPLGFVIPNYRTDPEVVQ